MSASREKKQRQGADPSGKVTQARQEQAAYKKKVRLYTVIGIVVAVLVAALLVWNSGFFQRRATAATVGGHKLTAGELGYFYTDARYLYAAYGILDSSKADDEQYYNEADGVTYRDYFLENALASAKNTLALYDEAVAAGYSAADVQEDLDTQIAGFKSSAASYGYSYKSYLQAVYGKYTTPSAFEKVLTYSLVANLYYSDVQSDTSAAFTGEELEAYYADHTDEVDTFTYSYLYFKADTVASVDTEGNERTDEEIAELKAEAMEAARSSAELTLALYQNGDKSIADLIGEREPTSSADHTQVTGSDSISSIYRDDLLELGTDEAAVVEYEDVGYYVVIYHGRERNEEPTANIRSIFVSAETTTDAEGSVVEPTDEAWAAAEQKANNLLNQWKSGEQTAESFGALADANGMSNGGLSTGLSSSSTLSDAILAWLFEEERQPGNTDVLPYESGSTYGYHAIYFQEWDEAVWMKSVRATLTTNAMNEWMEGLAEGYDAALAGGAKSLGT